MLKGLALKLLNRIDDLPIIDLIPIFIKAWDGLSDEKKIEYATSFIQAGAKAAKSYAEKK